MEIQNTIMTPFSNPLIRFIAEKKYRWLRHVLFVMLGLILAFKGDFGASNPFSKEYRDAVILVDGLSFIFIMLVIYLLVFVFVPFFLFRSRLFLFSISFLACIFFVYFVVCFF